MRTLFSSIVLSLLFSAGLTFAAELVTVHPAYITTPNGTDSGSMVMAGNQFLFVDNTTPANSFAIPRSQITSTNVTNGVVTLSLQRPFVSPLTTASTVVVQPTDSSAPLVAAWVGHPPTTTTAPVSAQNVVTTSAQSGYDYPARFEGHDGMLHIGSDTVAFNANNPKHSIAWNYDMVKKVEMVAARNEVKVALRGGDTELFHITGGQAVTEQALNLAQQRIAAAPHYHW
jgi:hypothetical protein